MGTLQRDLIFALRQLRQRKLSTVLITALLALGIGSATLIFTFVNAILLKSLPVRDPQNLYRVEELRQPDVHSTPYLNYIAYSSLARNAPAIQSVIAEALLPYDGSYPLTLNGQARLITSDTVSYDFFCNLGVKAIKGRVFTPGDANVSGTMPAVVSYHFWRGPLGSATDIPGHIIRIKNHLFTIVGVLPRDFHSLDLDRDPDVTLPLNAAPLLAGRPLHEFYVFLYVRLKPGATITQAAAQTEPLLRQMEQERIVETQPNASARLRHELLSFHVGLRPLQHGMSQLRGLFSHALILLMAAGLLLLFIVCFHVGGLLLARAQTRRKEIAIRLSLGAHRSRILRQVLTESLLLAAGGTILGTFFAYLLAPILVRLLPVLRDASSMFTSTPFVNLTPDWRILSFVVAACLLTSILFGLIPALASLRVDLNTELKLGSGTPAFGSRIHAGSVLIGLQVMLATVLVIASSLMIRTYWNLLHAGTGLDSEHIVTFRIDPRGAGYKSEQLLTFYRGLQQRVELLPQVRAASWADRGLMRGKGLGTTIVPTGQSAPANAALNTSWNFVSPNYFNTMGIPLLEGRDLRFDDPHGPNPTSGAPPPVVVNEAFARAFFPHQDVLGRTFSYAWSPNPSQPAYRIVGLVADAKYRSLREVPPPTFYSLPEWTMAENGTMDLNVRTYGDPRSVIGEVRAAVKQFDPQVPIIETSTMVSAIESSLWQERLVLLMIAFFGATALLLSAIGLYGALTQAVTRRTREIGIRMALGATVQHIVREICSLQSWPVLTGIIAGLLLGAALTRFATSLLYGVTPLDHWSYVIAAVFVLLTASLAALPPSLRGASIQPASALRNE